MNQSYKSHHPQYTPALAARLVVLLGYGSHGEELDLVLVEEGPGGHSDLLVSAGNDNRRGTE